MKTLLLVCTALFLMTFCVKAWGTPFAPSTPEKEKPQPTKVYEEKTYLCHTKTISDGTNTSDDGNRTFFVDKHGNMYPTNARHISFNDKSFLLSKHDSMNVLSVVYFSNTDIGFYVGNLLIDREKLTFVFTKNYLRKSGKNKYFAFKGTCS